MITTIAQPGILASPPLCGRSLTFRLAFETDPRQAVARLRDDFRLEWGVVGLGDPLIRAFKCSVPGLRTFPSLSGAACSVPSTQQALWVQLRGQDRSATFDASERVKSLLGDTFILADAMDTFTYAGGRDLTGYLDGTANPSGEDAVAAAIVDSGQGMAGSSFLAVQRWVHDLPRFRGHTATQRDAMIGRRLSDNEELADAPVSAHVKRSAQEDFDPPAFMVRRSMPWSAAHAEGLEFIAYGKSLDPFERVLRRMVGLDDGIIDALFTFSRPVSGGYYWCSPVTDGRLDVARLGL